MPAFEVSTFVWSGILIVILGVLSFFRFWKFCSFLEFPIHIFLIYNLFFRENPLGVSSLVFLVSGSILFWLILRFRPFRFCEIFIPIGLLVLARVLPLIEMSDIAMLFGRQGPVVIASTGLMSSHAIVGLSYFSFRWMRLGYDVKKWGSRPNLFIFLTYCFYTPIFLSGPITSFEKFSTTYKIRLERTKPVLIDSFSRLLWGATKFYALSALFFQITLTRQLMDRMSLSIPELLLGLVAYPAYLFLNFSGFTDIVVGGSAILGYEVDDNFDRPYLAVNLKSFWRRWHMSLTRLLGDVIYVPFVKYLDSIGVRSRLATYVPGTLLVFLIMAAWHGMTWNFFVFSGLQASGLILEEIFRLKLPRFYLRNPWLARFMLWGFLAISFFFFENNPEQIKKIIRLLGMGS